MLLTHLKSSMLPTPVLATCQPQQVLPVLATCPTPTCTACTGHLSKPNLYCLYWPVTTCPTQTPAHLTQSGSPRCQCPSLSTGSRSSCSRRPPCCGWWCSRAGSPSHSCPSWVDHSENIDMGRNKQVTASTGGMYCNYCNTDKRIMITP